LPVEEEQNGVTPDLNWQAPYLEYLLRGELPIDKTKARWLARCAKSFVLLGDEKELYHRSPSGILQRCISIAQGQKLLQEIHSGACGHHAAPRALVGNAFRQGFYWPTTVADATRIVRSCRGCQFYAKQMHPPAQALQTIPITWPFALWGLDLVRPLQKAPGGFTYLLVATDKFSKWIEVRPLNSIRSEQAVAFFTNIIHWFRVPNSIITDNGTQFTRKKFLDFCDDHHIRVDWAAVAHPMTNGQVESANGMILQGLKPRIYNDLNKFGKRWMKELPSVVWSLRTTPSHAMGFTLFFLVYGAEAVLPTDLDMAPRGPRRTTTKATRPAEKTRWTNSRRLGMSPYYIQHDTSSRCGATMPEAFGPEASVGTMLRRRRSCRKKQLRLKLSACDDRRFLFMKLRNYKAT
jgi:transposase InsO family protein